MKLCKYYQIFCKMVAHMTGPTGQHHVRDDSHYLTSGKNESVQILIKST